MRRSLEILFRWHVPALGFVLLTLLARAPNALLVILTTIAVIGCVGTVLAAGESGWIAILVMLAIAYPFAVIYDKYGVGGITFAAYALFAVIDFSLTVARSGMACGPLLAPVSLAFCAAGFLFAAATPVCAAHSSDCVDATFEQSVGVEASTYDIPSPYPRIRYWLLDSFGMGHRIDEDRSVLLLRSAAPTKDERVLPHIKEARVESCGCRWRLAEVYSDVDQDFRAYGSRFTSEGILTFHRWFGMIAGTESVAGAKPYTMPGEQWLGLRADSELPCAVCLEHGRWTECPPLSLSDGKQNTFVHACKGGRHIDD